MGKRVLGMLVVAVALATLWVVNCSGPRPVVSDVRLVALLQMAGVACEWIMRGDLAVARLQSNPPDLLILDVGLPDISGVEVYHRVMQTYPALPTLFSTGHGDHRLLNEFDPSAPLGFLSKPYGMDLLTRRVRSLLELRRHSSTA